MRVSICFANGVRWEAHWATDAVVAVVPVQFARSESSESASLVEVSLSELCIPSYTSSIFFHRFCFCLQVIINKNTQVGGYSFPCDVVRDDRSRRKCSNLILHVCELNLHAFERTYMMVSRCRRFPLLNFLQK